MNETHREPHPFETALLPGAALLLLAVLAYTPGLAGGFIWDDDAYVTENPTLRTTDGLWQIWAEPTASPQYYPLVFTTFWLEYRLWGLWPAGYHATNVLLHGLGGLLLWRILLRLRVPAPWLVAAVFMAHPVHVESVAWVTERKNVLSGFFYLAAALAYLHFSPPDPLPAPARRGWYALALGLFLCALLSKTVTCSLPAALLLVYWWKRDRLAWRDVAALAPLFVLGASLALVTVWMEKYHVGAFGKDWELSPIDRVLIAGRALWFYAWKLVFPVNLTFIYPRWHIDASAAWQYVFPLSALAVLIGLWLGRHRLGKGPLVACLFFAGTLTPALGFIDVYPMRFSFVADHFQYLASIGLLALLVAAGREALIRSAARPALPAVAAGLVLVLGALTFRQAFLYVDLKTLWEDTLAKNPDCWMAHNNLGELLLAEGKVRQARLHYREAARLEPEDPSYHYNVGKAAWFLGDVEEAVRAFRAALEIDPNDPEVHFNLGLALRRQGQTEEGIGHLRTAVRLRPGFALAHNNLGVALAQQGKPEEAIPHFLEAVRADPDDPGTYFNLALAHAQQGKLDEAIRHARQAAERGPADPRFRQLLDALLKEREWKKEAAIPRG